MRKQFFPSVRTTETHRNLGVYGLVTLHLIIPQVSRCPIGTLLLRPVCHSNNVRMFFFLNGLLAHSLNYSPTMNVISSSCRPGTEKFPYHTHNGLFAKISYKHRLAGLDPSIMMSAWNIADPIATQRTHERTGSTIRCRHSFCGGAHVVVAVCHDLS